MQPTRPPRTNDWHTTRARAATASGTVERDGVTVFWETFGSGGPAILILPTWSVLHAAHGRFQIADLARDHTVITFDGRGNGRSDRPLDPDAYADREFIADAIAVLDATGTDRAVVVACSSATFWQLGLAADHPDRVAGIVASGSNLPLAPGHDHEDGGVPFGEPYVTTDGWAKWNAAYWRDHYEDFLRFFFSQVWNEPHSMSVIEDCVAWGLETSPEALIASAVAPGLGDEAEIEAMCARVTCPVLVVHGANDVVTPVERSVRFAEATHGRLVVLEGSGHCSGNRDPVIFDHLIREFVASVAPAPSPRRTRWRRAVERPRRVLFIPEGGRPMTIGRDLAIATALRAIDPSLVISWLVGPSSRATVTAHGEVVEPMSDALLDDAPPDGVGDRRGGRDLVADRSIDEALFANFMAFDALVTQEPFDLVVADGAWHIDHYLLQAPERKRCAFAWLTDRVGWAAGPDETERQASLRVDANAAMVAGVERYPHLRDVALFVGDPATELAAEPMGPGLPSARAWAAERFEAIQGAEAIAERLRALI